MDYTTLPIPINEGEMLEPVAVASLYKALQPLSCYEVATGIVVWHCNVQEKENEISALKPLLTPQLIKGGIFT